MGGYLARNVRETVILPKEPTTILHEGSQLRKLTRLKGGGITHCVVFPGVTAPALVNATVHEMWYFLSGRGTVWRKDASGEEYTDVSAGVALSIPAGTRFQFRNEEGTEELVFLIVAMPNWPSGRVEKFVNVVRSAITEPARASVLFDYVQGLVKGSESTATEARHVEGPWEPVRPPQTQHMKPS